MTVKQLKDALAKYPDNMDVFIAERKTEFAFGLVNSVTSKVIDYMDDPYSYKALAQAEVVIIDED